MECSMLMLYHHNRTPVAALSIFDIWNFQPSWLRRKKISILLRERKNWTASIWKVQESLRTRLSAVDVPVHIRTSTLWICSACHINSAIASRVALMNDSRLHRNMHLHSMWTFFFSFAMERMHYDWMGRQVYLNVLYIDYRFDENFSI